MPINPPLRASGPRELKRPRPIPRTVRDAIVLMVYGKLDDPDCKPLDFIEAAKLAGIKPDVMRRYLDRAEVRILLRNERRAFRDAICAGNEGALRRVRDKSANGMATVAAVRALEQIDEVDATRPAVIHQPGITIRLVNVVAGTNDAPTVINAPAIESKLTVPEDPIFRSR
jgi:hypothetical protein